MNRADEEARSDSKRIPHNRLNLLGRRFERLLVVEFAGVRNEKGHWRVICDCGQERVVIGSALTTGKTQSCGCLRIDRVRESVVRDLSGQRFGRLIAIEIAPRLADGATRWVCQCDCGSTMTTRANLLLRGHTKSCGCYARDRAAETQAKEVVGYVGAHDRVRRLRGVARLHRCIDCGEPAEDWSYDGNDPAELIDQIKPHGSPYSLLPKHYDPRCRPCHAAKDAAARRATRGVA